MRVVDLFAGCGGMSKGFENAGFELTLAVERWKPALDVYKDNFDHLVSDLDLANVVDAVELIGRERPDLIIGGPPCQEFSAAGSRVEGARANLSLSFAEIVAQVNPKWFVLENVQGIRSSAVWKSARDVLETAGYGITEVVLNAAFFGVPQNRKRFFAVGCMGQTHEFLADYLQFGSSEKAMTIRDYVGDEFGVEYYYRHPRNWGRKAIYSIDEPSPTIRSTNRPVGPGYTAHPDDAGPFQNARPLSVEERARVQTFDSDFVISGTKTNKDIMVANAVPVQLARHVGNAIGKFERGEYVGGEKAFHAWLMQVHGYKGRTAGNVLSRLHRVDRMLGEKLPFGAPESAIGLLEEMAEFNETSSSVRSQIKKAIRLRYDFYSMIRKRGL